MSVHAIVKARTAAAHRRIDVAYSSFDLADRDSYISFLRAHARVLPAIEASLGHGSNLPPWRPRAPLLSRDLNALGDRPPNPQDVTETTCLSEKFGLLYVLEGSRLGGRLLSHRVGLGFPSHYLSAAHAPGEWRAFVQGIEDRAISAGADWIEGVVAGANFGFNLFEVSAAVAFAELGRQNLHSPRNIPA